MSAPHIAVLYNEPVLPPDHRDYESEAEVVETATRVGDILAAAGFRISRIGVSTNPGVMIQRLHADRPDAVFNFFEGLADQLDTEPAAAGLLDWLGIPYTGCPAETLALARDKQRAKHLFRGAGLPTAPFFVVERLPCPPHTLDWPLIVKPCAQDASVGIDQASVVVNPNELERRVAHVLENYGSPVLVEKLILGRELFVTLTDIYGSLQVLPFEEIHFADTQGRFWPVYTYTAKWHEASDERQVMSCELAAPIDDEWRSRISQIAREAYRLLGCRDYARVDVRVTPSGEVSILEVNPNPFILSEALDAGLPAIGRKRDEFLVDVARAALARGASRRIRRRTIQETE
jgi:D-alanine-D-alanine ligase